MSHFETTGLTSDEIHVMAVHEAGHAVVAMYLGVDVLEMRIDKYGGECTHFVKAKRPRSIYSCIPLGGYFACSLFCRDAVNYERFNNWINLEGDLERFSNSRNGMSYRFARNVCLGILRDEKEKLFIISNLLERDLFVDFTNCPNSFK